MNIDTCKSAGLLLLGLLALSSSALAFDLDDEVALSIAAQPLDAALLELSKQAEFQLVISASSVPSHQVPALSGRMPIKQALEKLLINTNLQYKWVGEHTVVVAPASLVRPVRTSAAISAQDGAAPVAQTYNQNPDGAEGALEEVVVTATRRELRLQDVPVAVTALSGAQLERIGADGFADFFRTVPGLAYNQADANLGNFSIRGISHSVMSGNVQSTVALYIDDLPTLDSFGTASVPDLRLFDVERIEVLRGPQGTLFGSGSMGGAIRVITRKPDTSAFGSAFSLNVSDTQDGELSYGGNAMVNIPLSEDRLALRAVGYYRDTGGYVDNVATGVEDANTEKAYGGRMALKFEATDDLSFTGTVTYQNSEPEDSSGYQTRTTSGEFVHSELVPRFTADEMTIGNFVIDYSLGWANLYSSTSYVDHKVHTQADISAISPLFIGVLVPSPQDVLNDINVFTQELRLASSGEGRWDWLVGAFYLDSDRDSVLTITVPGAVAVLGPFGFPSDKLFDAFIQLPNKEKALFGEVSFDLTPTLQATVGARWFENESVYDEMTSGFLNGGDSANVRETQEDKITPKFVLSYRPAATAMIYASASQGYRVGQNNPVIPPLNGVQSPPAYEADTLWNYEIGAKTSWLNNRLVLNGAIYHIDWSNMQVGQSRSDGFSYIANVGSAHSTGIELELTARLGSSFDLTTALSYNEAQLDENNPLLNAREGDRLPGAPKFTLANGLQYTFAMGEANAYARIDHQFVGESFSTFNPNTALPMGDYHNVDLRAGYSRGAWEIAVFARNVLDDEDVVTAQGSVTGSQRFYLMRPRTIGVELKAEF